MQNKRYEILDGLPPYGSMYKSIPNCGKNIYSEGFVVRFFKEDGTDWVANFTNSWTELTKVIELPNSNLLLVLAKGTAYIVNPNEEKIIDSFGMAIDTMFQISNNILVFTDCTHLIILEPNNQIYETQRISWDGFKDVHAEDNTVRGLSYDPCNHSQEWVEFSYNLESKELIGGSYNNCVIVDDKQQLIEQSVYTIEKDETKDKWWKFW